jgi:ubiquitin carboxyl-terminal hydrolase 4/11/15
LGGGHYTAYCKNSLTNKWYQYDDSRVSELQISSITTKDTYVLFYIRRTR